MRNLESGGGGGQAYGGGGGPKKPEKSVELASHSSAKWLYLGTALTALSFLSHILFLFLVEPLKMFSLTKADAYVYSGIPLALGIAFFLFTILSFRRMTQRSEVHVAVLIGAIIFGSLNIQGVAGIILFFAKGPHGGALLGH
jgi:hypothetical protein